MSREIGSLGPLHRLLSRIDRWFHAGMVADIRLIRSFTILHLLGPFFGLALAAMMQATSDTPPWVVSVFSIGVSLFWTFPFLARWSRGLERAAFGSVQLLVLISLFLSFHHGSLNSPFAVWAVVATLLSFMFAGRLIWWCLTATAGQLLVFYALMSGSVTVAPSTGQAATGMLFAASVTAATFYISFISIFYARIKTEGSALAAEAQAYRRKYSQLRIDIAAAAIDDRRRSAMLSKLSHELRTPLNVVIGYSEMLLEDAVADERLDREEHLRVVMQASRSLLTLVDEGTSLADAHARDSATPALPAHELPESAAAPPAPRRQRPFLLAGPWARLKQMSSMGIVLLQCAVALALGFVSFAAPGRLPALNIAFAVLVAGSVLLWLILKRSTGFAPGSRWRSGRDDLTGLRDRQAFQCELDRMIETRAGEAVALLFADLDGFKDVNDSLGHDVGDQLLRRVAERFAAVAPSGMLLGRLGGDEIGAVAVGEGAEAAIQALADAWVDALVLPVATEHDFLSIGVSIGIASGRAGAIGSRELLRRSDVAMYRAKADKRQPVQLFDLRMDEALSFRRTMRQDLEAAIRDDQLQLVLQPVVEARTGEIASAEALLRWTHPVLGPVSPAKLIPLAEESGQIIAVDDWVLEQALRYARELPNVPIAVNVSPIQFRHPGLARKIVDRLEAYSVPASRLRLEITEGVLVTHTRAANRAILELREAGIAIALDDFGTGFSSLSYLKDFQFDFLKIDRSFLRDLDAGQAGAELLRAIVDLGHSLKMKVIAEGVESPSQASVIQLLGCDYIQGYLTGRPMSFEAFQDLLPTTDPILARRAG